MIDVQEMTFAQWDLPPEILASIANRGWTTPSEIQIDALPIGRSGRDVLAQAKTGSGKTAAFGIPALERCEASGELQCLILTPTRELASQVAEELDWLQQGLNLGVEAFYGGVGIEPQISKLKSGTEVVVGTPGRIIDLMRRGEMNLDDLRVLVLDEADRMLDMGFFPDVQWIVEKAPEDRQTMLYSATFPQEVLDASSEMLNSPEHVISSDTEIDIPDITQYVISVGRVNKSWALGRILDQCGPDGGQTLVFCNTKRMVEMLDQRLSRVGIECSSLQGDMTQKAREKVMGLFKAGELSILVATDVAARGLHVDGVARVVNYDMPNDADSYVHRIGRTGRMGSSGDAWTLATGEDRQMLEILRNVHGLQIPEVEAPELSSGGRELFKHKKDWDEKSDIFGMVGLELGVGRRDGVNHQKLVDWMSKLVRLPDLALGAMNIGEERSSVDVHKSKVEYVISAIQSNEDFGRKIPVDIR